MILGERLMTSCVKYATQRDVQLVKIDLFNIFMIMMIIFSDSQLTE